MNNRNRNRVTRFFRRLDWASALLMSIVQCVSQDLSRWRHRRMRVEVLLADDTRRRTLERELRRGLHQLRHVLGTAFPADLAVVVQQMVATDRQIAGRYQVGQRPDGTQFALAWLALQVGEQRVSADELLAMLAELCIGLATHELKGPSVLIPVKFETTQPVDLWRANGLPPDPLATRPLRTE